MKRFWLLTVWLLVSVFASLNLNAIGSAVYWTSPVMPEADMVNIAKHDLAIVDLENLFNNPERLKELKRLNPEIKVVCYVNFFEIWGESIPANRPFGALLSKTIEEKFPEWLLKGPDGKQLLFWQGMKVLNQSDLCPTIDGYNYSKYIGEILLENILNNSVWDGLFLDNLYDEVSWLGPIDLNLDGQVDGLKAIDYSWYRGINSFLTGIRQAKGKNFLILGNHLSLFYRDKVDGRMLEDFPTKAHGDWNQAMRLATQWPMVLIQGTGNRTEMAYNSSLLVDNAYFCLGNNLTLTEERLNKINEFKKMPLSQRGSLIFNSKDNSYSRQLGGEIITVKP